MDQQTDAQIDGAVNLHTLLNLQGFLGQREGTIGFWSDQTRRERSSDIIGEFVKDLSGGLGNAGKQSQRRVDAQGPR